MVGMLTLATGIMFTGCGSSEQAATGNEDQFNIVCTMFPQYDWVKQIVGDTEGVEVTLLLDEGVDMHSYQPTAQDIVTISNSDLFIYVGGESDRWVETVLAGNVNPDMKVINLMNSLGSEVKAEEIVEGMEHTHDETCDHEHTEEEHTHEEADTHEHAEEEHVHEHTEEATYDEHIWLSTRNAAALCEDIYEELVAIDATHKEGYTQNLDAYLEQLYTLDTAYKEVVQAAKYDTVLVGDRFPFRYLTDDYDLDYYAAFTGCSADTEASFDTVVFLAEKMDELQLPAVLVIEGSDQTLAKTIISSTQAKNQKVLALNSMQVVRKQDLSEGMSYISVMEDNLEVLKEALN